MQFIQSLLQLKTDERIIKLRENAKSVRDPSCADETLNFLLYTVKTLNPEKILEIGTAEGLSGAAMLLACERAKLTTIEFNEERYFTAKKNFTDLSLSDRVDLVLGDAGEVIDCLSGTYDLIFLDGPKAQYINYLPRLKQLLRKGGVLFADDVLLFGWVNGKEETPHKRRSIVEKLKRYLTAVSSDSELITSIFDIGEGVAVSVKI